MPPSVRPSVCPSVTFSFRTVTRKRIAVFSQNFVMGVCCIVFDIDGMLFEFFSFYVFFTFYAISNISFWSHFLSSSSMLF